MRQLFCADLRCDFLFQIIVSQFLQNVQENYKKVYNFVKLFLCACAFSLCGD